MNLTDARLGQEYIIKELNSFLFTLGCYSGEPVTVVSHLRGCYVISIKDGRYNIDANLAEAILI